MAKSIVVKNNSGQTISAGKAVYITGFDDLTSCPTVALADYTSESTMPAIGVLKADLGNNQTGPIISIGLISYNTTSAFEKAIAYVGPQGSIVFKDPTDTNADYVSQQIGIVTKAGDLNSGLITLSPLAVKQKHAKTHQAGKKDQFLHAKQHLVGGTDPLKHSKQHQLGGGDELAHGNLSGLSADDHEQYSLVDGSRAFTGKVSGVYPTSNANLATKQYVDDVSGTGGTTSASRLNALDEAVITIRKDLDGYASLTGAAFTGSISIAANLTVGGNIVNKDLRNTIQSIRQALDGYSSGPVSNNDAINSTITEIKTAVNTIKKDLDGYATVIALTGVNSNLLGVTAAVNTIKKQLDGYASLTGAAFAGNVSIGGNLVNDDLTQTIQSIRQALDGYAPILGPVVTGTADGYGIKATGGATNGAGVLGIGVGSGAGVIGVGSSGYGVVAMNTSEPPSKAPFCITPQSDTPTTGALGELYVNLNGSLMFRDGTDWGKIPRLDASGDLGIGVAPSYRLHVEGGASASNNMAGFFNSAAADNTEHSITIGKALAASQAIHVGFHYDTDGSTSSYGYISYAGETLPSALTLKSGGRVGVGVLPTLKFEVADTGASAANKSMGQFYMTDLGSTFFTYLSLGKSVSANQSMALGYTYDTTATSAYSWIGMQGENIATSGIRFYAGGTIQAPGSIRSTSPSLGVGYETGAGSSQAQGTNRANTITINTICGNFSLFSAAGSATWASVTISNTSVEATDTIICNQKSGTNVYLNHITAVAAGSFRMTYATTGGVATDAPVFNFSVIKAVTA
jgi:hypothetical protein